MRNRSSVFIVAGMVFVAGFAVSARQTPSSTSATAATQTPPARPNPNGWNLPTDAADQKNPFAGDAKAVASGKELFKKSCQKCHGPGGKGDGPDADPDAMQDMDLTNPKRGARNPDGVVFYKAWNGRAKPKMPAVKDDLTKDQLWQIVSFVQTLREKSPQ
jgi:mono/diheme cytochrome c family protein